MQEIARVFSNCITRTLLGLYGIENPVQTCSSCCFANYSTMPCTLPHHYPQMQTPENRSNQILCDMHALKRNTVTKTNRNKKQKGQEQQTERVWWWRKLKAGRPDQFQTEGIYENVQDIRWHCEKSWGNMIQLDKHDAVQSVYIYIYIPVNIFSVCMCHMHIM